MANLEPSRQAFPIQRMVGPARMLNAKGRKPGTRLINPLNATSRIIMALALPFHSKFTTVSEGRTSQTIFWNMKGE